MKIKLYFRFKPQNSKVALKLGQESLLLAVLKDTKKGQQLFLKEIKAPLRNPQVVSRELKAVFSQQGLSKEQVSLVIPRHLAIVRFLHLPSTDEKEINSMAEIEAMKQIPYRIQDLITGKRIIEKQADGYSAVLSAAVEASQLKPFLDILDQAGIKPEKITLSSEALFAWYSALPDSLKTSREKTIALISLDPDYIDIVILENQKIRFTRGFVYNSSQDKLSPAIDEIKKSLLTYQRQASRQLNQAMLTGAQNLVDTVFKALQPELEVKLQLVSQNAGLEAIQEPKPDFKLVSFAGLAGLVLKGQEAEINLLPQEMAKSFGQKALRRDLSKVLFLLFLTTAALVLILAKQVWDKSTYLKLLNAKLELIEPQVIKAKAMRENIKVIRSQIEQKPLAIEALSEVYKAAPQQIKLNLFDYKSGGFLSLKGTADSLNQVIYFVANLDQSPYFENVRIKYTAQRKTGSNQAVDFELAADLISKF